MRLPLLFGVILLALPGCGKEQPAPTADDVAGPQIATSIDDVAIPVDRSDQITAIDAATGDSSGMPRDGGAVVKVAKPEAREAVEPSNAAAPVPVVAVPAPQAAAPVVITPPPPAPAAN